MSEACRIDESVKIDRGSCVGADWEYQLAGQLLGTVWEHPVFGEVRITEARTVTVDETKFSGRGTKCETVEHPAVVLDHGQQIPVVGFLRRIDARDVGDIQPVGELADQISKNYIVRNRE